MISVNNDIDNIKCIYSWLKKKLIETPSVQNFFAGDVYIIRNKSKIRLIKKSKFNLLITFFYSCELARGTVSLVGNWVRDDETLCYLF